MKSIYYGKYVCWGLNKVIKAKDLREGMELIVDNSFIPKKVLSVTPSKTNKAIFVKLNDRTKYRILSKTYITIKNA